MIVAEGHEPALAGRARIHLQWGRNMIVAEGPHRSGGPAWPRLPSMGPQHDSCGRQFTVTECSDPDCLQWGRNMIVAEGSAASV